MPSLKERRVALWYSIVYRVPVVGLMIRRPRPIRAMTKSNECSQCIKERVAETGTPEQLVLLPNTAKNGTMVTVCPFCDGHELLEIALKSEA